jgi:uncharacterized repeat protein (TIGR01451 family)/uncharacterized delta-60 repeat protein
LKRGGQFLAPVWLLAAFLGVLADARAQYNPPANDNLTNAQFISGPTGTVLGNNLHATVETGEPAPVAGVLSGATIWYEWMAPMSQWMEFDTRGSSDLYGNPMYTVLGVYDLTAENLVTGVLTNSTLSYADLPTALVADNETDPNTNIWPGASKVNFQAILGDTYLIQVGGQVLGGVTNEGYVTLNWGRSAFGGVVQLTTNLYRVGQWDNYIEYEAASEDYLSVYPSLMNWDGESTIVTNPGFVTTTLEEVGLEETNVTTTNYISTANEGEVRITVTRTGGYNGRILVDLVVTNDWYTNLYVTNIYVTNITIETINTNDGPLGTYSELTNDVILTDGYTNTIVSNINTDLVVQYDDLGTIAYYQVKTHSQSLITSSSKNGVTITTKLTTNAIECNSNAPAYTLSFNTFAIIATNNVPYTNYTTNADGTVSNNVYPIPASYIMVVTNYYITNLPVLMVGTPSALADIDYNPEDYQTIMLDDFQTYKDAFVNIYPYEAYYLGTNEMELLGYSTYYEEDGDETIGEGGPDWPDILGNDIVPGIPRRVVLRLVNPRLDPLESLDVEPPILIPYTNTSTGLLEEEIDLSEGLTITNVGVSSIAGSATNGISILDIMDFYNAPVNPLLGEPCACTNFDVYNFDRRTYRCDKPQGKGNSATIYLFVYRPVIQTYDVSVAWTIDDASSKVTSLERASSLAGLVAAADNALVSTGGNGTAYDVATPLTGTITFAAKTDDIEEIPITIYNNGAVEYDMEFSVTLAMTNGAKADDILGNNSTATVVIQFDNATAEQQPGGAVDVTWNEDYQTVDPNSYYFTTGGEEFLWDNSYPTWNSLPGADQEVLAIALQADGKAIFGGGFHAYDATNFNYLVRTLTDGLPDFSFGAGVGFIGPNDAVTSIALDSNQKVIIGGYFTSYNGVEANHVARLNTDGTLDTSFNTGSGANGTVWAVAVDHNNNVIIGGDFTSFNSTNRNHIARLLGSGPQAGSLDTSFNPVSLPNSANPIAGTDQDVLTVAADSLNDVVIGGSFSWVNGTNWPGLARLTPTGALDTNFNPGNDVNGTVYSLVLQSPGNQIVIGGSFSQVNHTNLNGIGRLNYNGSVDNTFAPGAGVNGPVYAVAIQPFDGKIVVGGQFTSVGTVRRNALARFLTNGWVDTSFMDTSYNQFAGLPNHYYNPYAYNTNDLPAQSAYNSPNFLTCLGVQPINSNILIGGSFVRVGGGGARDAVRVRWNVAEVVGPPTPGPQGYGYGLGNNPGNLGFILGTYTANDAAPTSYVSVERLNGSLGPATLVMATNLYPAGPGAAGPNDFGLVSSGLVQYPAWDLVWASVIDGYGWRECDGDYGTTWFTLSIVDDKAAQQNLFAGLSLPYIYANDTFNLGGVNIPTYPAPASTLATLEIINDNFPAGVLGFSATNYNVVESAGSITIPVVRYNGNTGVVTVAYTTRNGYTNDPGVQTAIGNKDYTITQGTLTFGDEVTNASFTVPITDYSTLQSNKFLNVILSNPTGGAGFDTNIPPLLGTNSVVTIVDNHFQPGHLSLTGTAYSTIKGSPATVSVQRTAGALGTISVVCMTQDGTGSNGINYTAVSNLLVWTDSDVTERYVTIPTLEDNVVEGTKTFNVILTNALVGNTGSGAPTNNLVLIYPTNAVVSIADDDSYGQLNFSPTNINILQNGGAATVTVVRSAGTDGTISVSYSTANGAGLVAPQQPALAGTNYGATKGTLTFGPGVTSQTFSVPIYYTPAETNAATRVVDLTLSNPNPLAITNGSPFPKTATITILDNQLVTGAPGSVDPTLATGSGFNNVVNSLSLQPDGSLLAGGLFTYVNQYLYYQLARLLPDGSVDIAFLNQLSGSDGVVQTVLSQTPAAGQLDGPIMVGGSFAHLDSIPRNNIGRLNLDGSVDETFNPGSGADNTVYALVETELAPPSTNLAPIPAYIIGGAFANYNDVPCSGIARLTSAGQLDANFNVGYGVTSTNGSVRALAVQADGKVIVGGDFTSFNNYYYHHLVRLNLNGSVDSTFNADTGADASGAVDAIVIQPNGQIIIGGVFTNVNGVSLNHIARLNTDGSVDASFNMGLGCNDTVEALALDSQQRILAGGQFTRASGVTRNGITRLNPDGTVDPGINFGAGANGYVRAMAIQANDEINVGGSFTTFGGYAQNNFTRLFGGEVSGPGILNFTGPVFGVMENASNAVITIQRTGGTGNASFPLVSALFTTADGTARNGVDYMGVTNLVILPIGETFTNILVPVTDNGVVASNVYFNVNLSEPVGASLGLQPAAEVIITNANTAVAFSSQSYRQSENVAGGAAVIPIVRVGNPYSTITVTVYTGTNGSATPGLDYLAASNTVVFYPGVITNLFLVPLLNNLNMLNDETVDLELTDPVGAFLAAPSQATLTIATVYAGPGIVSFSQPSYTVSEGAGTAQIGLLRTNGETGLISVTLSTSNGTAIAGTNYEPVSQVVTFSDSQYFQSVSIPVIQLTNAGPDTTAYLVLSKPIGTTISGAAVEPLIIQDDIQNFTMGAQDYFVSEGAGFTTISVLRNGPTNGTVSVGYTTFSPANASSTNGYAVPGLNYAPTSGTLTFVPGQTLQTFPVGIYQQTTVDPPLIFDVVLTNASSGTQIASPNASVVTIIGDVTGFELSTNAYTVGENGGGVVVTVNRLNANTGTASVNYATSDSSAVEGLDYAGITNGLLEFADGQTSTNVTVTILDRGVVESSKTFIFALTNPVSALSTNCYLLSPSNAVVTITNNFSGFSFSSSTYSVSKTNVQVLITVVRGGVINTTTSVQYATADGTARAGINYFATSGTLTFAPGVTSQTFPVTIINDHIIGPDHTVILSLSNPQGPAGVAIPILSTPSNADLIILEDEPYVIPGGTYLVNQTFQPSNGLVEPGETVTVNFGMRNVAGGNTSNLVATLETFSFSSPVYSVSEKGLQAQITVVRSGAATNESVQFATADGTGTAGVNYVPTNGTLNFVPGVTSMTFSVTVLDDGVITLDRTVMLSLSNPEGGAILTWPSTAVLTVQEADGADIVAGGAYLASQSYQPPNGLIEPGETVTVDLGLRNVAGGNTTNLVATLESFSFSSPTYAVSEKGGLALITVVRSVAANTASTVQFATADGTGVAGVNYVATNGTLTFGPGVTSQSFAVGVIDLQAIGPDTSVLLSLTNAAGGAILGTPSTAVLTIQDADGADIVAAGTYLASQSFQPPNGLIEPGETVTVDLGLRDVAGGNVTNLLATLETISFASPTYAVNEKGAQTLITVVRSGVTGNTSSIQFATADGTGVAGVNYVATNGTLTFGPGVSTLTFSVGILDDNVITPDHTVLLSLSDPQGGAVLISPSTAVLTIQEGDGSDILPAGTCFVSGTVQPPDDAIDPGETVTVDFGLRCISGGNTTNLVATLLAGNGIIPGSVSSQTYGALLDGGHVVSEPFTFTAYGVNDQVISAVFQLQDGSRVLSNVVFSFILGATTVTSFTNPGYILITNLPSYGTEPTPAEPYPSSITVSNMAGSVIKATVGINGLTHQLPSDIMMVLSSPATNVLLMNDAGGDNGRGVTNISITFDDAAAGYAPSNQLPSGVSVDYKPTPYIQYGSSTVFVGNNWGFLPVMPSPPVLANSSPANSYATNLSVFAGTNINGTWSLYIADTVEQDYGAISNGWTLNLVTTNVVPSYTDLELSVVPSPSTPAVGNMVVYSIALTNYGPAPATGVFITNILPPGLTYVSNNFRGTVSNNNGVLTFGASTNALAVGAGLSFAVAAMPNAAVLLTNTFIAVSQQLEPSTNNVTNVVANLVPVPPDSQTYPVLIQGGHVVSEPFTFTANGSNGQVVDVALQLQEGATNLGTVMFAFTLGSINTFSNTALILITNLPIYGGAPTPATPYPSSITVTGVPATVNAALTTVTVTISNLTHQLPSDIEMVLASPATNVLLMSDVGGDSKQGVTNLSVTFGDAASSYMSSNLLASGISTNNKPTPYIQYGSGTVFAGNNWGFLPVMPPPVLANASPANSYATNMSAFAGTNINGLWSLYVADTESPNYGAISNGWSLNISSGNPVPAYTDLELTVVPSPSSPAVGGVLTYTVGLTNYGPAPATGVFITNIIPSGLTYLSNNFPAAVNITNGVLTFGASALAVGAGLSFNIAVMPNAAEMMTNSFIAISQQLEPSTNNITNVVANLLPVQTGFLDYGVLLDGGHVVSEPFTFTAYGTNGQVINLFFQLQDGTANLGAVEYSFTLGGTATFYNPGYILITNFPAYGTNPAPAMPYPSAITVSNVPAAVATIVTATISNLTHQLPSDIEMVLASPATNVLLMSDVGGDNGQGVTNFSVTFADGAANYMSSNLLVSGVSTNNEPTPYVQNGRATVFVGTNWGLLPVMPGPLVANASPANSYATNMSAFGANVNGVWSLYAADLAQMNYGAINSGWSLNISTGIPVAAYTDLELTVVESPASASVSNTVFYTVGLTNYGPAPATGVFITNIMPSGLTYLSNNFPGTVAGSNGVLAFSVGALAVGSGLSFDIAAEANAAEIVTNTFIAISGELEPSTNNVTNVVANFTPVEPDFQTYGVLVEGGHVVSEPFTFTAYGTNGQVINLFFQLQDGALNLGTVEYSFTLGSIATFSNPALILITNLPAYGANPTPATPYPSAITVTGVPSAVTAVTVTLSNLTHQLPSDIEMVLASPATNMLLMSDVGGDSGQGVTNLNLTIADAAAFYMPSNQLPSTSLPGGVSTNYKPTPYVQNGSNTIFVGNDWSLLPVMPSPPVLANASPPNSYATNLSVFNGTNINGAWSLYVADTSVQNYGAISNGWSLSLSTGTPVPSYADLELSVVESPAPATVSNVMLYAVALTNYGPAPATGVFLTNILPSGVTYLSNSFAGTAASNNGVLTFDINTLTVGAGLSFNIAVLPIEETTVTNIFIAISDELEASVNNLTNVVTAVGSQSADLGVSLNAGPNPVVAGNYETLSIVVTNNGPSFAYGTMVTNDLPAGLLLTGINAPPGTSVSGLGGTNIWNIGYLAANSSSTLNLTAKATYAAGNTVLDSVVAGSSVYDPYKLNNYASFKIVINPAPLISILGGPRTNTFTWNAAATNYVLMGATNLTPPVVWVKVTNVVPVITNGTFSVSLPDTTNGLHFFILRTPFSN